MSQVKLSEPGARFLPTTHGGNLLDLTRFSTPESYVACRHWTMLPEIEGARISTFPWNAFVFKQVLEYYDGPRLLLQRSRAGQLYLAWWNDAEGAVDRWIYLPVGESRLHDILSGRLTVLDALRDPEDGSLVVVDVDVGTSAVIQSIVTTAAALPQDLLPLEYSRLNIPFPEEFASGPTRERVHRLDVRIDGKVGETSADVVSRLVGNIQRLLDAIGQAVLTTPTSQGPVPNYIKQQTRLNLVGTYAGSLGLHLETDIQDNLMGDSLARSSLEGLFGLLEGDQSVLQSAEYQRFWSSRVAANYKNLLSTVETSSQAASLFWNQHGGEEIQEFKITPDFAKNQKRMVETITKENLHLEGIFEAGNIRTRWFRFLARGYSESFGGRILRTSTIDVNHISLGYPCRVIVEPNLQVNQAIGEEKTTYTFLSVETMNWNVIAASQPPTQE